MNIIETNFKWNGTFTDGENKPTRIVLHHAEASHCTVQDIHSWHLANGWAGIGYHYFVRKDGSIYRGRKEGWRGSHCPNANYNSIGICFEGSYMTETMPEVQIKAGQELIADIKRRYGITTVVGHRDLYSTDCPGKKFPMNRFTNVKVACNSSIKSNDKIIEGMYVNMKKYCNGSTKEIIYADTNLTKEIGSLDPYETCDCLGIVDGRPAVMYKVNGTNKHKIGFAKWTGGVK